MCAHAATAEAVILDLVAVLLGDKSRPKHRDNGLLNLVIRGRQHVPTCAFGQYLRETDRLTGGSPCSARCADAHAVITAAERWLQAYEADRPTQASLFGEAAG